MSYYWNGAHKCVSMVHCRHQLVPDDDLGSLYDLLIDDPPEIRHAIGALVYDHVIAQKFNSSQSRSSGLAGGSSIFVYSDKVKLGSHSVRFILAGDEGDPSQIHLLRMLQILREFSTDQILSIYVIDDIWEFMNAMKVSCIFSHSSSTIVSLNRL